ncbi:unnamed protein product [Brassica rapa]|uniref:Uncharacterized protein n=2 Tax=Brassica TaxID=3705 RepID=A0A8D9D3P4_BRACM|nr:unnamed protein product [Brassica rapa]
MSSWEKVYPSVILSSQNMVSIRALLWCFEAVHLYLAVNLACFSFDISLVSSCLDWAVVSRDI